ncbi:MAG: aquaporin family protein, partial [Oscillochloris sp.]|nr:aquaporin family protein [Oscillochloris sp.]
RDLGPRIAHFVLPIPNKGDSDWGYAWIPVVGPIIGAVLGAVLFNALV